MTTKEMVNPKTEETPSVASQPAVASEPDVLPNEAVDESDGPLVLLNGEPFNQLPQDLYIPPDALEVFLETFQGPLDLLLYLIKRQNLNILDIPIASITKQYMQYIAMMESMRFELVSEYLLMAAMLAEIKSRMLLPRPEEMVDEDDPRADLVRRLQEYERFKTASENLDNLPRLDRDNFVVQLEPPKVEVSTSPPAVSLRELLLAFSNVVERSGLTKHHEIAFEPLSVRERMSSLLDRLANGSYNNFVDLLHVEEGRSGVVVSFLAMLELIKEKLLDIQQNGAYAPIYIKLKTETVVSGNEFDDIDYDSQAVQSLSESVDH